MTKNAASKGKIIWESTDGNKGQLGFIMPMEVLSKILCRIINWESEWLATFKDHSEYQKELEKLNNISNE